VALFCRPRAAVACLSKLASMAKLKCAPFLIIYVLDISTIFSKNYEAGEYFGIEYVYIFAQRFRT